MMLGFAFGAGVLLSAVIGGPGRSTRRKSPSAGFSSSSHASEAAERNLQSSRDKEYQEKVGGGTWDNIKGALIGVAVTKCEDFLEELVPGFVDHYYKSEARNRSNQQTSSSNSGRPPMSYKH